MSETTAETWAVVDEAGAIHEVDVSEGRTGSPPWVAHVADGTARRSLTSARDAVVLMAQARGWSIVEVLAPGQVSRAGIERERDEARGLLDAVREALDPTCADATHAALPGLVAEVVACDAEMHREVDARGERLREMAAEVAHLEARRGALLAEIDRLTARDRVTWGAMPTRTEVKAHWWRGGLWAHRSSHLPASITVLDVRNGKVVFRKTTGKAWCAVTDDPNAQWRAVTVEEVARG